MLATFIHFMRGTPYIYQGEELGMTNAHFSGIEQYQDLESINYYGIMTANGRTKDDALNVLAQRSRDNSRTPMQWDASPNAGFTSGTSWLGLTDNYRSINAESEENDPDSILNYYRKLVALRKEYPVISDGAVKFLDTGNEKVIAYERTLDGQRLVVICSFSGNDETITGLDAKGEVLIGNYSGSHKIMKPYEAIVMLSR